VLLVRSIGDLENLGVLHVSHGIRQLRQIAVERPVSKLDEQEATLLMGVIMFEEEAL
jgi:hypothetical protein